MRTDIAKSFVVNAPAAAVWDFLTDPVRVAGCLPGAAVTRRIDERTHAGTMTVKIGPVATTYKGTLRFDDLDAAGRSAAIVASGQDVRGRGGAEVRMHSTLVERAPGTTDVSIVSHVDVLGVLAQFGSRMIQDVGDRLFDAFVTAVRAELERPMPPADAHQASGSPALDPVQPTGTAPIELLSFGSAVAGRAAARALAKPAVWAGIVALILVLYWLSRG
jgi:carbon monoxide dehydrogenase subunit G